MDGKYLRKRGRTWYVRFAIPEQLKDVFGSQEFVQSLRTKDFQEAKFLKLKFLDRYAQMISSAKRHLDPNKSKEDQIRECGLLLRQFNEKDQSQDDTWISDVLEAKLEELWGPKIADAVLNGQNQEYKGKSAPIRIVESL